MSREPLVPHDSAQTLAAGGIVGKGAKLPAEERTTAVAARAYTHPALPPDRVVVRLEPEAVADGTDAEMAAFGFAAPDVGIQIGMVRYRTLGFPAWGLVNAPKAGKVALGVMEDVRKAKRLVAAKPGHAKEAFEKIAKTLQKASPQLLPSFWEEVGRTVADLASAALAAQCFERARQAERAFKLKVDPDDGDAVFLEFALLGALSAKTLGQYAKDLAKSEGGAQAYKRFRTIAVKRALGGMPPWSGMGKDLSSLAKAAELDIEREDEQLVVELLEAPAINKAPNEFWQTYRDALARVASREAPVRARLRVLWPEPKGQNRDTRVTFRDAWVGLLDEVGALKDLPDEGLGAWMSRLIAYAGGTPRVVALLEELAPRLQHQSIHVSAPRGRWGSGLSLDLAERALELGIPLAETEVHHDFDAEMMTVNPVRVAAHPFYGPKLVEAVDGMIGEAEAENRMRGKSGFDAARAKWLVGRLDRIDTHPLGCALEQLDELESKTTADSFLSFPELYARFKATELAGSLAAQLRGGLVDEFAWPAYEAAVKSLEGPTRTGGAFPIMTVWNATKAIAVGAGGVVAEHDLVYKQKEHTVDVVMFLDGQFLVALDPVKGYGTVGYWSSAPKNHLELKHINLSGYDHQTPLATTLSDGSITLSGNDSFRAGDVPKSQHNYMTDGAKFWQFDYRAPDGQLVEFDPIKAAKVGNSVPEFFTRESASPPAKPNEDGTPAKWETKLRSCSLAVAPAGYASSPLGISNGLCGLRVRESSSEGMELARIDGVIEITDSQATLVMFPGDATPRHASHDGTSNERFLGGNGAGIDLYIGSDAIKINSEECDWASRGWAPAMVPPLPFWHMCVARDAAASARLRTATAEQARALIASAELTGDKSGRTMPKTEALIRETFGVTDAAVVRGIAGVVEHAAELQARIAPMAADRAKENAGAAGSVTSTEGIALRKMFTALVEGRESKIKDFEVDIDEMFGNARGTAVLALSPLEDADKRRAARAQLAAIAATPFADDVSKLRLIQLTEPEDWSDPEDWGTLVIKNQDASTFAINGSNNWALEYSRDGVARVPPPWLVDGKPKTFTAVGADWVRGYLELPDEEVPWDNEIAVQLAAKSGLSIAEATLLYLGMPGGYSKDFLGKQKREKVGGLKVGELDAAKTTFQGLGAEDKAAMMDAAAPADPALLRTPLAAGGFVDGLAREWKKKFGKRMKIPQDLVVALKKDLQLGNNLPTFLPVFSGSPDAKFLNADLRPLQDLDNYGANDEGLNADTALTVATLVSWLFISRPVGDAIRGNLVEVVEALRKVVDNPAVIWQLNSTWIGEDPKHAKRADGIFAHVGGKPMDVKPPKEDEEAIKRAFDNGVIQAIQAGTHIYAGFRPAKADGQKKQLETLLQAMLDSEDGERFNEKQNVTAVAAMLHSDGFEAFAERVKDTPVTEGGYEANPALSVPKLVAKVVKETDLSPAAAALYLQVLTLAEPTERAIQLYNGWTAKQYKAAAAELAKSKLVVEGKRERAGRSIFLKGGYSKGSGKDLPMEDWKAPFYGWLERGSLPAEPIHLLFAKAWKRVEDGDKP